MSTLVKILVGAPGSGKSHYARSVASLAPAVVVVSADDFFMVGGEYRFDVTKLGDAHAACVRAFVMALTTAEADGDMGDMTVIVDNTNTSVVEMATYYNVARAFGASVEVVVFDTPAALCIERCSHGVPAHVIEAACQRVAELQLPPFWEVSRTTITAVATASARRPGPEPRKLGAENCSCYLNCGDDTASGTWHQHEDDLCPVHPDATVVG